MCLRLIGGEPDMKTYIKPLDNTNDLETLKKRHADKYIEKHPLGGPRAGRWCGRDPMGFSCNCWVCQSVRWKLFKPGDINLKKEDIVIYGIRADKSS
jgi:hypothetical protein